MTLTRRRHPPSPTSQASGDPPQPAPEYTIDELARAAGTTVRNVRSYQDRGL